MKIFDISKNIILVFIILISIALNLFAHESTTSLSNDNVSIEKDKNKENISKKKPKKVVLCYERNRKSKFDKILPGIYVIIGAFCGASFTLLASVVLVSRQP